MPGRPLQPWEEKLLGRRERKEISWLQWAKDVLGEQITEKTPLLVDYALDYLEKNVINPEVKTEKLYGKKIDRPWGREWDAVNAVVGKTVNSSLTRSLVNGFVRRTFDPKEKTYLSGAQVAAEIFAPSFMQKNGRPSCRFEDAYLVEFYNETGIMPDESSMIGTMLQETMHISERVFTEEEWRKDVLPTILQGSFQTELKAVFDLIRKDAEDNPAITPELVSERMDRAAKGLGRLYTDFSRHIANTTGYLEIPLVFTEAEQKRSEEIDGGDKPLTTAEKQKLNDVRQPCLISAKQLDSMKKASLKLLADPASPTMAVHHFFRAVGGSVGREEQRQSGFVPADIHIAEKNTPQNRRSFLAAAVSLRQFRDGSERKRKPTEDEKDALELMKERMKTAFGATDGELSKILDPKTPVSRLGQVFGIDDTVIYGYEKREVPAVSSDAERQNSIMNLLENVFPSKETAKNTLIGAAELVKNAGSAVLSGAKTVASNLLNVRENVRTVVNGVKNVAENGLIDLADTDLFADLDEDELDSSLNQAGSRQEENSQLAEERKRAENILREQEKLEQDRLLRERAAQQEAEDTEKRTRLLDTMEPWQQKLIGHKARFTGSWMQSMLVTIAQSSGASIDDSVDAMMNYVGNAMQSKNYRYSVYGKTVSKNASPVARVGTSAAKAFVTSDFMKNKAKNAIRRALYTPGMEQFVSGEQVALACFAPTFVEGKLRPPCRFTEADMAKVYNACGVYPNEADIAESMMNEALKITDSNYSDTQWREIIMPTILRGSYEKELTSICRQLADRYEQNPMLSKELLSQQMDRAAAALGEMYASFSEKIADHTEYLDAPMTFLPKEKAPLRDEVRAAMTAEQQKAYDSFRPKSLTNEKFLRALKEKTIPKERKKKTSAEFLEDFIKISSGYRNGERTTPYTPQPSGSPGETAENKNDVFCCIAAARAVQKKLSAHGILDRLFRSDIIQQEKLILSAMKDRMLGCYGIRAERMDELMDPALSDAKLLGKLGVDQGALLGYEQLEITDEMKKDPVPGYMDSLRNHSKTLADFVDSTVGAAKGFVNAVYNLLPEPPSWLKRWQQEKPESVADVDSPALTEKQPEKQEEPKKEEPKQEEPKREAPKQEEQKSEAGSDEDEDEDEIGDRDEFEDAEESFADEDGFGELSEELPEQGSDPQQKLESLVENVAEPENTSYLQQAMNLFSGGPKTKEDKIAELAELQNTMCEELGALSGENTDALDRQLGKLQYTQLLIGMAANDRLSDSTMSEALKENVMESKVSELLENPAFRSACRTVRQKFKTPREMAACHDLPGELHMATMQEMSYRKAKTAQPAAQPVKAPAKHTGTQKMQK